MSMLIYKCDPMTLSTSGLRYVGNAFGSGILSKKRVGLLNNLLAAFFWDSESGGCSGKETSR